VSVMMISEVSGQSAQGYDGMRTLVGDALQQAPGFSWRIVELWNSREDVTRFFATHVALHLPDGVRPKLSFQPLHSVLKPPLHGVAEGREK
jgi:hypothetical protein